jgi:DNA mismatch endonuclease, patch repair protein
MTDVFSKMKRSDVMSRIRSQGNAETELALIQIFRSHNIVGWRRNWPLKGKPDFVFPLKRLVIFVDGCFWHSCPVHGTRPSSNEIYWQTKLERNRQRDELVTRALRRNGWKVLRFWHHDLLPKNHIRLVRRIRGSLDPGIGDLNLRKRT